MPHIAAMIRGMTVPSNPVLVLHNSTRTKRKEELLIEIFSFKKGLQDIQVLFKVQFNFTSVHTCNLVEARAVQ